MRPVIDSRSNKVMSMPHLRTRAKKKMMEAARNAEVRRENVMLLQRLSHVMRTKQVQLQATVVLALWHHL